MGPRKGGSKPGRPPPAGQKAPEGLAEVAAAYLRFRKSPASLKVLKKAAEAHPSALAQLCLAKAALLQGVHAAIKADDGLDGEAALLAAAHTALWHVVTAAVEHRSLVALQHAVQLLERVLLGLPGWELRHVQRVRLLQGLPVQELCARGAAAFEQLGQDVIEQELWKYDLGYTRKDGLLQDPDEFARRVASEYQTMAASVAEVARKAQDDGPCYDEGAVQTRQQELDVKGLLDGVKDDEAQQKMTIAAPLSERLVYIDYLPRSDDQALLEWIRKQRAQQRQRRRQQGRETGADLGRRLEASNAQLEARQRATKLAAFLRQQLSAECGDEDAREGSSRDAAGQERRVAALLRLASMPLSDFRRQLADEAAGPAAEPGASVAGAARAVAAAADAGSLEQAIQLLGSGSTGPAQLQLPAALLERGQLPARLPAASGGGSSGGSSNGGSSSSSSGGSGDGSRQQFLRLLEQLVSDPEGLAECKRQLCNEVSEFNLILDTEAGPPEKPPPLPSDYLLPGLDLPPSAEAIMPAEPPLAVFRRDSPALHGPTWRQDVLRYQTQQGRSRLGVAQPPGICVSQLTCCEALDDRGSRCFDQLCFDLCDLSSAAAGLAQSGAAHIAAELLSSAVGADMWQSQTEMCLKRAVLGYGLIEAVVEQQGQQHNAQPETEECRRGPQLLGRRGGWELGSNWDDSDDEAAGGLAGTFVGGGSPRSPRSPGSPAACPSVALLSAGAAATSSAAAAATASAEAAAEAAAARLAELHAAAASIHTAPFAEMLRRIVPEGEQQERALQACAGALAAAKEALAIAPALEAGNLMRQLLPIPDGLLSSNTAGTGVTSVSIPAVQQLRRLVLRRILAGLRHLASQDRLYRGLLLERVIDYVSNELEGDSQQLRPAPGSEQWAPWNRLGVAPLRELLTMYGTLAVYFSREFAAGPAALGPRFQDAVAQALTSVQLLPSLPPPAAHSQGGAGAGEGEGAGQQQTAVPGAAPVLGLSRRGLGNMAAAAAGALRAAVGERSTAMVPQLVRKSVGQAVGAPASVAPAVLPAAGELALCLALCAERVPAAAAALRQLHGNAAPASEALDQLRRLQLWRDLVLHGYHRTAALLKVQQQTTIKLCAKLMQALDQPAGQAAEQRLSTLCGTGSEPGLLGRVEERCHTAGVAIVQDAAEYVRLMHAQELWLWHRVMAQLRTLMEDARSQIKRMSEGSAARASLSQLIDRVANVFKHVAARLKAPEQMHIAAISAKDGALQYARTEMPMAVLDMRQLTRCAEALADLRNKLRLSDGSDAAVRAVLAENRGELRDQLLEAQSRIQTRLHDLLNERLHTVYMADLVLRSEMSVFCTHFCMRSPLDALTRQLIEHALPRKWAQQMAAQQAAEQAAASLLGLAAPPSAQPSAGKQEEAAAAKGGKGVQQQDEQAQAEAERQRKEADAAAAALLEEEERQAEKQAKERQRKQQQKKQAVQQRAAAAAAAAAAKRKAEEEEAAAAAAAAAAAREEAEREAAQRRRAQQEEEQRRQQRLLQEQLEEQTRQEAELLHRQRQERRRQQEEAEQRRRQQEEAERQRRQQQELEAEQRRQQQAEEQAQAEQQRPAKAAHPAQQPNGGDAGTAAPAVVTPAVSEQLSARRPAAAAADSGAEAAAPAGQLQAQAALAQQQQQAHQGPPAAQPQQPLPQPPPPPPRQQPQARQVQPLPQHTPVQPQGPAPSAGSRPPAATIDLEEEMAAQQRLYGADGELDITKLGVEEPLAGGPTGTAGTAAPARPGGGAPAGRQPVLVPAVRPGSAGRQRPGSAGVVRPGSTDAGGQRERPPARFVSWTGAWVCECGQRNENLKEHCRRCDATDPCVRWFLGRCAGSTGRPPCHLPHLWFDLPTDKPTREDKKAGRSMARPNPNFIYKPKPRVASAAKPAGAAWRPPSAAVPAGGSWDAAAGPGQQQQQAAGSSWDAAAGLGPQQQAAGGAVLPAGSWAAAAKPPSPAAPAAGQPAGAMQQQQAEPGGEEVEDELASLLGNLGISASSEAVADLAPSSGGWSFDATPPPAAAGETQEAAQALPAEAPGSWPAPGEDAEDAELAAAIKASLADVAASASRHQAGAWQEVPPPPARSVGAGAAQDSEAPALAGLRNEAGEYNCFLNVVVQCLWRCAEFRQQVAGWDARFCARDPVLAALHDLFAQLEQQEAARSSAAARGGASAGSLPPVDPAPLREALAALPGQGFSLGEMNDAAELLLCVYEKVMEAETAGGRGAELAATFGLAVREEVHCSACGKTTHQNAYTQYFYNTQATTLQMAALVAEGASMGALLREAEAQHRKSCDTDVSGCGELNGVNHFLQAAPRVFTLQVAWETHAPDPEAVAGTLAALDEQVDLGEVYQGVERGLHRYALRSMVCYYGQHYQALVLVPEAGGWLMFDDTRVSRVGTWADVRRKCEAGRIQPSVLFYEAA